MFSWTIVKYANALNCHVKLLRCSVGKLGNCLHGKSALFKTIIVLFFLVNESCSELFVKLTGHEKFPEDDFTKYNFIFYLVLFHYNAINPKNVSRK